MSTIDIVVPDIGDFKDVAIIELLVKPGDSVAAEQSLITVESDKASMEIPSSHAGVVKELKVSMGDKVSQGSLILTLEGQGAGDLQKTCASGWGGVCESEAVVSGRSAVGENKGIGGAGVARKPPDLSKLLTLRCASDTPPTIRMWRPTGVCDGIRSTHIHRVT